MTNWKTTLAAVAAAAFAVYQLATFATGSGSIEDVHQAILAALAAFGFSFARDADT